MRDTNYRSVASNKAAVTITTSLYDRRALDVTSDKPLVNSLNHLTYLVSLSAKVRETLLNDGGIERLVEILHECRHKPSPLASSEGVFSCENKLLTAWKWTLAFQCLVLTGTRGTEKIRQRVVRAGMLPVIATVLDNYSSLHENQFAPAGGSGGGAVCAYMHSYFNSQESTYLNALSENAEPGVFPNSNLSGSFESVAHGQRSAIDLGVDCTAQPSASYASPAGCLDSEDYDNLSVDQLFKLIRCNMATLPAGATPITRSSANHDIRRRYLIVNVIKKLLDQKSACGPNSDIDMDTNLQFLSDMYLQDEKSVHMSNVLHSKIAPRNFTESGLVIPRDDDVVWCLQLLAYISKYPYLKEVLQNTHLVPDMSIRDKQVCMFPSQRADLAMNPRKTMVPRSRRGRLFSPGNITHSSGIHNSDDECIERFNPSPSNSPQMLNDVNIRSESFDLNEDKLDLYNKPDDDNLTEDAESNDFDDDLDDFDEDSDHRSKDDDDEDDQTSDDVETFLSTLDENVNDSSLNTSYLSKLYDDIIDAESIPGELEREVALLAVGNKINLCLDAESRKLKTTIIAKRSEIKELLSRKWNYETYEHFDIDDDAESPSECDYDSSLIECKKVNLFPMVEKFTFLAGTDMYYWSGVIMRNSCRRNDFKGGVRQCGNIECGKWESYPREFSKCKKCKRTKYCSRDCQMKAWHCHKNWCVPSNSSSASNNTSLSTATNLEGLGEVAILPTNAAMESEGMMSTSAGDMSQQVSASDQEAQFSEL